MDMSVSRDLRSVLKKTYTVGNQHNFVFIISKIYYPSYILKSHNLLRISRLGSPGLPHLESVEHLCRAPTIASQPFPATGAGSARSCEKVAIYVR